MDKYAEYGCLSPDATHVSDVNNTLYEPVHTKVIAINVKLSGFRNHPLSRPCHINSTFLKESIDRLHHMSSFNRYEWNHDPAIFTSDNGETWT